MTKLTERLENEPRLRRDAEVALARLRARRDEHDVIVESGGPPGGGPDRVKCLHSHLAHELAMPPAPIGALTLAETGWPDCRVPCVAGAEQ